MENRRKRHIDTSNKYIKDYPLFWLGTNTKTGGVVKTIILRIYGIRLYITVNI